MRRLLGLVIVLGLLSGCHSPVPMEASGPLGDPDLAICPNPGIIVSEVSPTGLTFQLENSSDQALWFGDEYIVFVLQDGQWVNVPPITDKAVFTSGGTLQAPWSTSQAILADWRELYGGLPSGDYMFQKVFGNGKTPCAVEHRFRLI